MPDRLEVERWIDRGRLVGEDVLSPLDGAKLDRALSLISDGPACEAKDNPDS